MWRIFPLLFFVVGCVFQPTTEPRRPDPENEPTIVPTSIAIEKPTYLVEAGPVSSQLFSSGRITPVTQSELGFPIGGQIETLFVSLSSVVEEGDIVATLDTTLLEQALLAAEADLAVALEQQALAEENRAADQRRAEINVELIQLQLDFAIEQAGESPTSEQMLAINVLRLQLELAQLDLTDFDNQTDLSLTNQIAQAQLQIESLQTQIAQSTLVAPIGGTVMVVNVGEGASVSAEQTVLVVADLNEIEVQIGLIDRELETLSEDMVAFGVIPSRPEVRLPMKVRVLPYPYGSGAQDGEANGIVRLSFDDASQDPLLAIGDRIEITIQLERRENVLWLPPAAIREFNGRLFVVVQEGQSQQRLDIRIGLQNDNQVEIVSGLSEGQIVVGP